MKHVPTNPLPESSNDLNPVDLHVESTTQTEHPDLHEKILSVIRNSEEQDACLARENKELIFGYVAQRFENRTRKNSENPLKQIPRSWLKLLIREALNQNPWTPMKNLEFEFQGRKIKLYSDSLDTEEFKNWYNEAIDKELEDPKKAHEFTKQKGFTTFGGWERVKRWHAEIMEYEFAERPYTNSTKLLETLANYYRAKGQPATYNELYAITIRKYVNRSYQSAKEFIFSDSFMPRGNWALVEDRWIIEFLKEAYAQNPLNRINSLGLSHKGKHISISRDFFSRINRLDDLNRWITQIMTDYPDNTKETTDTEESMDRVVAMVTHPSFKQFGGWKIVSPKWRKILIMKAILQSEDTSNYKKLVYTHHDGKKIGLKGLHSFYRETGQDKEFKEMVRKARETKKNIRNNELDKQIILGIRAEEGDKQAMWALVNEATPTLKFIARRILRGSNQEFYEELVSEGIQIIQTYAASFDYSKGVKFQTLISSTLQRDLFAIYAGLRNKTTRHKAARQYARHKERIQTMGTQDYSTMFSTKEIAIATKQSAKRITADRIMTIPQRSLDAEFGEDESITLHERIGEDVPYCELIQETRTKRLIRRISTPLKSREKFILRHMFQLGNMGTRSIEELQTLCPKKDIRSMAITAMEKTIQTMETICRTSKTFDPKLLRIIEEAIEENKDPLTTLEGKNKLGKLLREEIEELKIILNSATGILDNDESVVLAEIIDMQYQQTQTLKSVGSLIGLSRERVRQLLTQKILPKMRSRILHEQINQPSRHSSPAHSQPPQALSLL